MNVLLVDDHRLLLEGLSNLLTAHGVQVVGIAHDGSEAIAQARALKPDVILMDIRMPRCDGLYATRQISAEMPEIRIVILTTSMEDQDLFEAIKSGAFGYLLKSMDVGELMECLEQVQQGIPPFSPGLADKLLGEFARLARSEADSPEAELEGTNASTPADNLTPRQHEVLSLVAQGYTYKETALKLGLSPRTIKYHMAEIMNLLHLENRAQLLAYSGKIGLGGNTKV